MKVHWNKIDYYQKITQQELFMKSYQISPMYVMTGDCIKPIESPIKISATNISQTLRALYIINHAIPNGILIAIIVRLRPKLSEQIQFIWKFKKKYV